MSFAGVYKLGEQPTVGERLEETRKVKQEGKEGLVDLNAHSEHTLNKL